VAGLGVVVQVFKEKLIARSKSLRDMNRIADNAETLWPPHEVG
jgi:hypothetical protein